MPRLRVVLDTNVYISVILFGGRPEKILDLARRKVIEIYISQPILTEIEKVLRQKFHWNNYQIKEALFVIKGLTTEVVPKVTLAVIKEDAADNRILEAATSVPADFVISGDGHLLKLGSYRKIRIISPADFTKLDL